MAKKRKRKASKKQESRKPSRGELRELCERLNLRGDRDELQRLVDRALTRPNPRQYLALIAKARPSFQRSKAARTGEADEIIDEHQAALERSRDRRERRSEPKQELPPPEFVTIRVPVGPPADGYGGTGRPYRAVRMSDRRLTPQQGSALGRLMQGCLAAGVQLEGRKKNITRKEEAACYLLELLHQAVAELDQGAGSSD